MAEQKFSAREREAIWLGHSQKCYYCTRPILFSETQIDHFIAESTSPPALNKLVSLGVIKPDFDVQEFENLVPACGRDNCDKHDSQFEPTFIAIHVQKIARKAVKVRKTLKKSRALRDLDKIFRNIQVAIDDKRFSSSDLSNFIRNLRFHEEAADAERAEPPQQTLLFTQRAIEGLRNNNLDLTRLPAIIERAARGRRLDVHMTAPDCYLLRLSAGVRLLFRQTGDAIIVETIDRWSHRVNTIRRISVW